MRRAHILPALYDALGRYRLGQLRRVLELDGRFALLVHAALAAANRLAVQRMMMIVAQNFEQQRLTRDVVDERARHCHAKILNVKEAERRTFATILDGLRGECLVVSMHEIELTKYVRVFGGDARYFQYDDAKLELGP